MDWSRVLEWIKPGAVFYFAAFLTTTALLVLPQSLLQGLGLSTVSEEQRSWIGLLWLASGSLSVVRTVQWLFESDYSPVRQRLQAWSLSKRLTDLSEPEKMILRKYLANDTPTLTFPVQDGVVRGLVAKKILFCASEVGMPGTWSFPFNLQPWARQALRRNPSLLARERTSADEDSE